MGAEGYFQLCNDVDILAFKMLSLTYMTSIGKALQGKEGKV